MRRAKTTILITVAIWSVLHCARSERPYRAVSLHSGKVLKVLSTGRMRFSDGTQAVTIQYETNIPTADVSALRAEADEIWPDLQHEVEQANVGAAILMASPPQRASFISHSRSYNFAYVRANDGTWHLSQPK
jgi:hypothetical protein